MIKHIHILLKSAVILMISSFSFLAVAQNDPVWVRHAGVTENNDGTLSALAGQPFKGASSVNILKENEVGELSLTIDRLDTDSRYYVGWSRQDNTTYKDDLEFAINYNAGLLSVKNPANTNYTTLGTASVGDVVTIRRDANGVEYLLNGQVEVSYLGYQESYVVDITMIGGQTHPVTLSFSEGFHVKQIVSNASCGQSDAEISLHAKKTSDEVHYLNNVDFSYVWKKDGVLFPACTDGTCSNLSSGVYEVTVEHNITGHRRVETVYLLQNITWINQTANISEDTDHALIHTANSQNVGASSLGILKADESGEITIRIDEEGLTSQYHVGLSIRDDSRLTDDFIYGIRYVNGMVRFIHPDDNINIQGITHMSVGDEISIRKDATGVSYFINDFEYGRYLLSDFPAVDYVVDVIVGSGQTSPIAASFCEGFDLQGEVTNSGCGIGGGQIIVKTSEDGLTYSLDIPNDGDLDYNYVWTRDGTAYPDCTSGDCIDLEPGRYEVTVTSNNSGYSRRKVFKVSGLKPIWSNLHTSITVNADGSLSNSNGGLAPASTAFLQAGRDGSMTLRMDRLDANSNYYIGLTRSSTFLDRNDYDFEFSVSSNIIAFYPPTGSVIIGHYTVGDEYSIAREGADIVLYINGLEHRRYSGYTDAYSVGALVNNNSQTHPIDINFCENDCGPVWVRHAGVTENSDGTLSAPAGQPFKGASSVNILQENESGELNLIIDRLDTDSRYYVGWSQQDNTTYRDDLEFEIHYNAGQLRVRNPINNNYDILGDASIGDVVTIRRDGNGVDYLLNGQVEASYPGYQSAYVVDATLYGGQTHPITLSFCEGFHVEQVVVNTSCDQDDGEISLQTSTDGDNYTLNNASYNYTWRKDGVLFPACTDGTCSNLSSGVYEITVEHKNTGHRRIETVYLLRNITWINQTANISEDADHSLIHSANSQNVGASSLGILRADESGEVTIRIDEEDLVSNYHVGFSIRDDSRLTNDFTYGILYTLGRVRFIHPDKNLNDQGITHVSVGDEISIRKDATGVSYYFNGFERRRYLFADYPAEDYVVDAIVSRGQTHPIAASFCEGFDLKGTVTNSGCGIGDGRIIVETSEDGLTYSLDVSDDGDPDYNYVWTRDGTAYPDCTSGECIDLEPGRYEVTVTSNSGYSRRKVFTVSGPKPRWTNIHSAITVNADGSLSNSNGGLVPVSTAFLQAGTDGSMTLRMDRLDATSNYYVGLTRSSTFINRNDYDFEFYVVSNTIGFYHPTGNVIIGHYAVGDEYSLAREGDDIVLYINGLEHSRYSGYTDAYSVGALVNNNSQTHPIDINFCENDCGPVWVRHAGVIENSDGTLSGPAGQSFKGASSVNILQENEVGELNLIIDRLDTDSRYYIGWSQQDNTTYNDDLEFVIYYSQGQLRVKNPANNNYTVLGDASVGDVVTIRRDANGVDYLLNGQVEASYPGYQDAYVVDATLYGGQTHPITLSFCEGFHVEQIVTNASCDQDDGEINLHTSTDGDNYTLNNASYNYTWRKDGVLFPTCTDGSCSSLSSGVYEITVEHKNTGHRRVETVYLLRNVSWVNKTANISEDADHSLIHSANSQNVGASSLGILRADESGEITIRIDEEDLTSQYHVGFSIRDDSRLTNDFIYGIRYVNGRVRFIHPDKNLNDQGITHVSVGDEISIRKDATGVSYYFNGFERRRYLFADYPAEDYVVDVIVSSGQTHPIAASFCEGFDLKGTVTNSGCGIGDGRIIVETSEDGLTYSLDVSNDGDPDYNYVWTIDGTAYPDCTSGECIDLEPGRYEVTVTSNSGYSRRKVFTVSGPKPRWTNIHSAIIVNADGSLSNSSGGLVPVSTSDVLQAGTDGSMTLRMDRLDATSNYYVGLTRSSTFINRNDYDFEFYVVSNTIGFYHPTGNVIIGHYAIGDEYSLAREGDDIVLYINGLEHNRYSGYNDEYVVGIMVGGSSQTHPIDIDFRKPGPELIVDNAILCGNEVATLQLHNYTLAQGEQVKWYKDGQLVTTTSTDRIVVGAQEIGTYSVSIMTLSDGCESRLSNEITIKHTPVPEVVFALEDNNICWGEAINLRLELMNSADFNEDINVSYLVGNELYTTVIPANSDEIILESTLLNSTTTFELVSVNVNGRCTVDQLASSITVVVQPRIDLRATLLNPSLCTGDDLNVKFDIDFSTTGPFNITYGFGFSGERFELLNVYDEDIVSIPVPSEVVTPARLHIFDATDASSSEGCKTTYEMDLPFDETSYPTLSFIPSLLEICYGIPNEFQIEFTGTGPFELVYTDGDQNYTVNTQGANNNVTINLDENSVPRLPVLPTVYQAVSLKDETGCVNTSIDEILTAYIGGLPNGYLTAVNNNICEDEMIRLRFHKTYPLNDEEVRIKITDGVDILSEISSLDAGVTVISQSPLVFEFDVYGGTDAHFDPLNTFRLLSIEAVNADGSTVKSQGLASKVEVTVNKQPEAFLNSPNNLPIEICEGEEAALIFKFPEGKAPFTVKVNEVINGVTNVLEYAGLEDGEVRMVQPTANALYELVEVTDDHGCSIDNSTSTISQINMTVHELPSASLTGVPQTAICEGTEFTIATSIANTTSAPYKVRYTDGITIFEEVLNTNTALSTRSVSAVTNTVAEVLSVTDANNCSASANGLPKEDITVNPTPLISLVSDRNCNTNSSTIQLNVEKGTMPITLSYDRIGTATTSSSITINTVNEVLGVENEANITYTVTSVIDAVGCEVDLVTQPITQLINGTKINLIANQTDVCEGDQINLKIEVVEGCTPLDIEYTVNGTTPILLTGVEDGDLFTVTPSLGTNTYTVSKVNGTINTEGNEVDVTVNAPVDIPTGLTSTVITEDMVKAIKLEWTDLANEQGYIIKRKKSAESDYIIVGEVAQSVVSFIDKTVEAGDNYDYVVASKFGTCISGNSTPVSTVLYQMTFLSPRTNDEFCSELVNTVMWKGKFQNQSSYLTLILVRLGDNSNAETILQDNIIATATYYDWNIGGIEDDSYQLKIRNESDEESYSQPFNIVSNCIEPIVNQENRYHAELHESLDEQYHVTNGINLRFRLEEKYVDHQTASIKIYDWSHQKIAGFSNNARLMKHYGHNFYSIDLEQLSTEVEGNAPQLKEGDLYVLEVKDEVNNDSRYLRFKYAKAPELAIDIKVEFGIGSTGDICNTAGNPVLNFIPVLKENGTERYQIEWYFSRTQDFENSELQAIQRNGSGNALPKGWLTRIEVEGTNDATSIANAAMSSETALKSELVVTDRIDEAPYYIYLKVKDSCGNEKVVGVEVKCDTNNPSGQNVFTLTITDVNTNEF